MSDDHVFKIRATDRPGEFVPLAGSSVPAGFPSPAEDYIDRALDFNELLIENPAATFAVKIAGESMTGAGLFSGDLCVINRAREPINGCVVMAVVDSEFTIKRYRVKDGRIFLQAEYPAYPYIEIKNAETYEHCGLPKSLLS